MSLPTPLLPKKTFILGLGHQRTGTTWVSKHLLRSKRFRRGPLKEYHIWNALDVDAMAGHRLSEEDAASDAPSTLRYRMQNEDGFYFDYFKRLYSLRYRVSADFTPAYSSLPETRLRAIKDQFQQRQIDVKAVVIIRDPIARIKSATRFNLERGNFDEGIPSGVTNFADALGHYYKSPHCELRTSYHQTIERARRVFGADNLYVSVFENMFKEQKIRALSKFCGVPAVFDEKKNRINKTLTEVPEETGLEDDIRAHYQEVYDYCFENYPVTRKLWV